MQLRVIQVRQYDWDQMWKALAPESRLRCEWLGCDAMVVRTANGAVLVVAGQCCLEVYDDRQVALINVHQAE